jgi:uncharacterized protein YdiU (UPF0061 family)
VALSPEVAPTPVPAPHWLAFNAPLATSLGLETQTPDLLTCLAGNEQPDGVRATATAYGGHQFGVWAGQLGDGRALTLGQRAGQELQLKGAGRTPYSRGGDGRAVLRSSVREYLASEAMHALGIPTTRALALIGSPLAVQRESVETAALVTRVAPSFLRFGHFEWLDFLGEHAALRTLADQVIAKHEPAFIGDHAGWLTDVVRRTARLMAQWQSVGFCHGVMNTDNFSILGLTLDYGPYGFIDAFDANHICNHSDESGRYRYSAQPSIGQWNCAQLLNSCLTLLDARPEAAVEQGTAILDAYGPAFAAASQHLWRAKLGLRDSREEDILLINRWLTLMHHSRADFTGSFRRLAAVSSQLDTPDPGRDHLIDVAGYDAWISDYRTRLRAEQSDDPTRAAEMNAVNPLYVLRNHLAQEAIEKAQAGDASGVTALAAVLSQPFTEQPGAEHYAAEPPADQRHLAVSCSS